MREGVIPPNERWFMSGLTDGPGSQVFVLNIGDRQSPLIVKVRTDDPTGSIVQEGWVIERARDTGAPVPEVVYVGSYQHDGKSVGVLVQTTLPGTSLAEAMPSLSLEQRIHAFRQMGEALARVHQAQLGGFRTRQPMGGWDFNTWESLMTTTLKDLQKERADLQRAGLADAEIQQMLASLKRYADEFPCGSPALCHGDYVPEHVFVDRNGAVTGIIDFGSYHGGDPASDLATARTALESWAFDQFCEAYAAAGGRLGDRLPLHLYLSLLNEQVRQVARRLDSPGTPEMDQHLQSLRSTLTWLERNG